MSPKRPKKPAAKRSPLEEAHQATGAQASV